MKKLMLIGTLILVSAQYSCRTILRQSSQADSTAVRSEASSEKWAREIVREYLPGRIDTVHSMSSQIIQVPKVITVQQPVLIRESIRENAEKQASKNEEKTVAVQEKVVTKEGRSPWFYAGIGAGLMFVLLTVLIATYKIAKARILASIPKAA